MDIALFSGDMNDPASRFRYRQHTELLKERGINIHDFQAKSSQYPPPSKMKRPMWLIEELLHRYGQITNMKSRKFDLYLIQRELIATLYTLETCISHPKVFDLDDAVWIRQRFGGVNKILSSVDSVICGNRFIADYASQFNENIFVIPTGVDSVRFYPKPREDDGNIVIGWSGTSAGYRNVYEIEESLMSILKKYDNVHLLITSNVPPRFTLIPSNRYQYVPWERDNEAAVIQSMDIGLMPIKDTPFNQGKCAYKMLLYMACGIPVVVSPLGMNNDVLSKGEVGFGAKSQDDWVSSLEALIVNKNLRKLMGINGYNVVIENYSIEVIINLIIEAFQATCR